MAREIYLQRRHGNITLGDGFEVGAGSGVLLRTGGPDPVHRTPPRIVRRQDALGAMAESEPGRPQPPQGRQRHVRDVDIENECGLERALDQLPDELSGNFGGGLEVRLRVRRRAQGNRDGGQAEEAPLDGRRHGAGIEHVIAQVRAVVDPGDHHVMLVVEQAGDREVHAVGRRALNVVDARLGLEHPQGHIEGQGVARATAIAVRRDDGDLGEVCERLLEKVDPA